jgi:hypothetical protein
MLAVLQRRYAQGVSMLDETLRLCVERRWRGSAGAEAILGLASAHVALGNLELAAKLEAISTTILTAIPVMYPTAILERLEPLLRKARDQANPAVVQELISQRPLTTQTAITELDRHASETESREWPPTLEATSHMDAFA